MLNWKSTRKLKHARSLPDTRLSNMRTHSTAWNRTRHLRREWLRNLDWRWDLASWASCTGKSRAKRDSSNTLLPRMKGPLMLLTQIKMSWQLVMRKPQVINKGQKATCKMELKRVKPTRRSPITVSVTMQAPMVIITTLWPPSLTNSKTKVTVWRLREPAIQQIQSSPTLQFLAGSPSKGKTSLI